MNIKRSAVIAASAATIFSMAIATPSFAHGMKNSDSSTSNSAREAQTAHAHASVDVTITAVPTEVTTLKVATKGAKFVAYKLAADATAAPTTQPTTGGKMLKVKSATLTDGVLRGTLSIDAGAASTTTKYAVYNAAGAAAFVTVNVDAAGVATATTDIALTAAYVAPTAPALGEGKGMKGDRGQGHGKRMKMGRG